MSDSPPDLDLVAKAVVIPILKLDLKSGDILAIICPADWTVRSVETFGRFYAEHLRGEGFKIKTIFLPHGTSLAVVSPEKGD